MTEGKRKRKRKPAVVGEAIAMAKQQLQRMIDLTPQMMLLVDQKGKVIRCNRSLVELMAFAGYGEVLGRRLADLFPTSDPAGLEALAESRSGYDVLNVHVTTGGNHGRDLRFTTVSAAGDDALRIVLVQDVTGARERDAQIERSHKRDAVRALAGALMHRLNQPLTVIMVKAAMVNMNIEKGAASPEEIKAGLHEIMELTMAMSAILRKFEDTKDYATEPYPGGLDILRMQE